MKSFKEFCAPSEGMDAVTADLDYSIKEVCLTVFESMVKRCPKEITVHLEMLVEMVMELIGYDPNYNPDVMMGEEDGNFEEWGGTEEEQMEDDASWKVRRAAIKLLDTLIKYRYDKVKPKFDKVLSKIVERLGERESNIKCLLLDTFIDLINGVVVSTVHPSDALDSALELERKSSDEYILKELPAIVTRIVEHYEDKTMKVRESIALVLLSMALIAPDYMNGILLGTILPKLFLNFKDNSSTTKITVFQTLRRLMLTTSSVDGYISYLNKVLEIIELAIKEDYFKLSAEALTTAGVLVQLLMKESKPIKEAKSSLLAVYKICIEVLKHSDVDQEIKQAVIYTSGIVAANSRDVLPQKELDGLLGILQDRMKYEPLRLECIKAFSVMVGSDKKPLIEKGLEAALPEIIHMTKKLMRQVKLTALEILLGVCKKFPNLTKKFATLIIEDTLQVLKEGDLQLIQRTLKILVHTIPFASDSSLENLLEVLMLFCDSSLFQTLLDDAIPLLLALAKKNKGKLTEVKIAEALWGMVSEKNYKAISTAIASIIAEKQEILNDSINNYIKLLADSKQSELSRKTSAIILGCLGQHKDLSKLSLDKLIFITLKEGDENLKVSVAVCLGNIALGNESYYVPLILSKLKESHDLSYLMLVAIREIVLQDQQHAMSKKLVAEVLPALRVQSDTQDEGDRTIIAEIIGRLYTIQPLVISNEIETGLSSSKENVRATFALSFKYLLHNKDKDQFTKLLPKLLVLMKDQSLRVQKALLDSLTNITRQSAVVLRPYTTEVQEGALALTAIRPELVKIVDLGPLQHKIDEGQPTRKGAYTLIENMIDKLNDKMNIAAVIERSIEGLKDYDEVQSSCQQILIKLCVIAPETVVASLEKLIKYVLSAIEKELRVLNKKSDNGQEVPNANDNMRDFLKIVVAISKIPEIELNQKYQDAIAKLMKDKKVQESYEQLRKLGSN
jgi:cullin-associated NEDD8-dissociated protein 1